MDIVEQKLAGLESLPGRMTALESQFLQLHEALVEKIKLIQEGRPDRRRSRR